MDPFSTSLCSPLKWKYYPRCQVLQENEQRSSSYPHLRHTECTECGRSREVKDITGEKEKSKLVTGSMEPSRTAERNEAPNPGPSPSIQPWLKYERHHRQQAHIHGVSASEYLWGHPASQGRLTSYINTKDNPANSKLY